MLVIIITILFTLLLLCLHYIFIQGFSQHRRMYLRRGTCVMSEGGTFYYYYYCYYYFNHDNDEISH